MLRCTHTHIYTQSIENNMPRKIYHTMVSKKKKFRKRIRKAKNNNNCLT